MFNKNIFAVVGGHLIESNETAGKDHPSFTDPEYRKRRLEIGENSKNTKITEVIISKFQLS